MAVLELNILTFAVSVNKCDFVEGGEIEDMTCLIVVFILALSASLVHQA